MKKDYLAPMLIRRAYAAICASSSMEIPDKWGDASADAEYFPGAW